MISNDIQPFISVYTAPLLNNAIFTLAIKQEFDNEINMSLNNYLGGSLNATINNTIQQCRTNIHSDTAIVENYNTIITSIHNTLTSLHDNLILQHNYIASIIFELNAFWQQCASYCLTYPSVHKLISSEGLYTQTNDIIQQYTNRLFIAYDKFIAYFDKLCMEHNIDIDIVNTTDKAYWEREQRIDRLKFLFTDESHMIQAYTQHGIYISSHIIAESEEYPYDTNIADQIFSTCNQDKILPHKVTQTQFHECIKLANFSSIITNRVPNKTKLTYLIHLLHYIIPSQYRAQWQRHAALSISQTPSSLSNNKSNIDKNWIKKMNAIIHYNIQ